jgi:hypothetical protein
MIALVGVIVLCAGLVLMADRALADKDDKDHGSATDLRGVTQNWDKVLPVAQRFVILAAFNNQAVRDNETGLVWERSPDMTIPTVEWEDSRRACVNKNIGGRKGWRLPSVVELASLIDPSVQTPPLLPVGHPFSNVAGSYWSATRNINSTQFAWAVSFVSGNIDPNQGSSPYHGWCVRGGVLHSELY